MIKLPHYEIEKMFWFLLMGLLKGVMVDHLQTNSTETQYASHIAPLISRFVHWPPKKLLFFFAIVFS